MEKERKQISGVWYYREEWNGKLDQFWKFREYVPPAPGERPSVRQEQGDLPSIICHCGCSTFSLRYGNYEILARCSSCKAEESVYSG